MVYPAHIPARRPNRTTPLEQRRRSPLAYDLDKAVNLGRNYWGFDTTAAITYFNEDIGTEVSIAPGILANTRNDDTNYRAGAEFHLDFTANQFLFESFAIGVRGYFYRQVTGDSGSGAVLGDFKGEAVGVGPGFIWLPKFAEGKLVVQGKWMTDVHSETVSIPTTPR